MQLTLPQVVCFAALLAACQNPQEEPPAKKSPGLSAVPAGKKPPRPKAMGPTINMDSSEVRILVVPPGSPAAQGGFQAGDVIAAVEGQEIANEDQLSAALKAATGEKVILEVRREKKLLTLSLSSRDPGWIVLSGDAFKGFLLTRAQTKRKIADLPVGKPIPGLTLPSFSGKKFSLAPKNPRPLALLFWGTFLPPCTDHLKVFRKACQDREVFCLAVNTMELFTAVGKTREYQAELERVKKELWPDGPIPIDLFLESERKFGVKKLPTLLLVNPQGVITARFDGPLPDPEAEIPKALDDLISD